MLRATVICLGLCAILLPGATAQSLVERERMASAEAGIANQLLTTNERCGTSITASYSWAGLPVGAASTNAIIGACNPAVNALTNICASAAGREAVRSKVRRVACSFGEELGVTLDTDGTLRFQTRLGAPDQQNHVRRYLEGAL